MNKQIRIAILGDYIGYPSYFNLGSLEGAIRIGAWARPVPFLHVDLARVNQQIDWFKPDYLLCHCIFNKKPHNRDDVFQILRDTRKKWGTRVAYHMGDARIEPRYPHDISDIVDLGLINNAETDRWSKIWNIPCIHWPYPSLYQKEISDKQNDLISKVVFTGSLGNNEHHSARANFIEQLQKKLPIRTFPDNKYGNSMFMTDVVSSSANGVLSMQMGGDIPGYNDVRPFQYIGAGAVFFHDDHPNIRMFFEEHNHFIPYIRNNIDDFMAKFTRYADNKEIRQKGFEFCQKNHSTKQRVQMIIDFFNDKPLQRITL